MNSISRFQIKWMTVKKKLSMFCWTTKEISLLALTSKLLHRSENYNATADTKIHNWNEEAEKNTLQVLSYEYNQQKQCERKDLLYPPSSLLYIISLVRGGRIPIIVASSLSCICITTRIRWMCSPISTLSLTPRINLTFQWGQHRHWRRRPCNGSHKGFSLCIKLPNTWSWMQHIGCTPIMLMFTGTNYPNRNLSRATAICSDGRRRVIWVWLLMVITITNICSIIYQSVRFRIIKPGSKNSRVLQQGG